MARSKRNPQKQEEPEAVGNNCNDVSSERFLHRLRRCYVKITKPRYTDFHPHSARRIPSRKPLSQPRREQKMKMEMETLPSIPNSAMEFDANDETESSDSKLTFNSDVGRNAEADDHENTSEKARNSSPKKEESTFHPPARRISSRKTPSQLRREQEMTMEALLSIPEEEGLEVVEIPRKGRGVKARIPFKEGDFVCEYIGEFMSGETGRYMEKEHERDQSGSYLYFFWYRSDEYCIDATSESSKMGRLINHSRLKANLEPKVWEVRPGEPRLILQASKRIEAGEEILYDYGESRGKVVEELEWLKY